MPTAILSVHDKTGLIEFAKSLADLGWSLLASGGTAKLLRESGISITEVADYTGSPEILGGRVKTLHPAIHGGLLARPTDEDHQQLLKLGWDYIDLVAGHQLQLTKPDQSRTFAGIYLHESRLYILEATVPPDSPPPGLFQQSVGFLDFSGRRVRYQYVYSSRYPPPPLTGNGGAPVLSPARAEL